MNFFKKIILISILLFLLFGCSQQPSSTGDFETFRKGSQGMSMKFLPGNPPDTAFDESTLSVMIEYENQGASDLNGYLILSGFDPNILNFENPSVSFDTLPGKSFYNPEGGFSQVERFTAQVTMPSQDIDKIQQSIIATACYSYQTIAVAEVCIDPTIGQPEIVDKPCEVHSVSMGGGQGGPIGVTSIEQQMSKHGAGADASNKVIFKVWIQNIGGGIPFQGVGLDQCHNSLEHEHIDIIKYSNPKVSGVDLDCKPPNEVRLTGNQGFILCESTGGIEGSNAYTTQFSITLDYNYRQSISTKIDVVNIQ